MPMLNFFAGQQTACKDVTVSSVLSVTMVFLMVLLLTVSVKLYCKILLRSTTWI